MTEARTDAAKLEQMLRDAGWALDRITHDTWKSRFRGRHDSYPFFLRLDPAGYLTIVIVPYLRSPEDEPRAAKLYTRLLELNHSLHMAKFSIDDDLDVVLSVEWPSAQLDASELADALDVLSFYADQHFAELKQLVGS